MPSNESETPKLPRRGLLATGAGLLAGLAGCSDQRGTPPTGTARTASPPGSPDSPTSVPTDAEPAPELTGPWPTAHADPANTGAVDEPGPQGQPSVRWQGYTDLETGMWVASGPDGPVVTQENGSVVAYAPDGSTRWRHQHEDRFRAGPVVADDGTVVVGSLDGTVTAYDADGSERWTASTPEGIFAPHANDATPLRVAGEVVVLAHPRGALLAYGLATGTRRWAIDVPARCHRPVTENGRVLLVGPAQDRRNTVVQARSLADGSVDWRKTLEQTVRIGAGLADGRLYVGSIDGELTAFDAASGEQRWQVVLPEEPWISSAPLAFADQIWVGTLSEGLFAVTEAGVQHHVEMGRTTSLAVGDGRLYVGSSEFGGHTDAQGSVVAFDGDGTEFWRTTLTGHPNAQVVFRDGRVSAGTETGAVTSLAAADGDERWQRFERPETLPDPVVDDGAVYCGGYGDDVGGYVATDGTSHLWNVGFDDRAPATPVAAGQSVLAGSRGGGVAATPRHEFADPPMGRMTTTPTPGPSATEVHIDAPLPEPRWRIALDGPVGDFGYGQGGAYVGSGERLVALTVTGDVRWERTLGEQLSEAPAVAEGGVYAATDEGTLVSFGTDGEERWRQSVGASATAPAYTTTEGSDLLVVGTDTRIVAVDAGSGEERWSADTGRLRGSPAVSESLAIAGDDEGVLHGVDLSGGSERWRFEAGGAIHGAPAVGGDHAYVGSRDGYLYAVSVSDGEVAWRANLGDWVDGSPALAYGAVFVVDQSGSLSAITGQ